MSIVKSREVYTSREYMQFDCICPEYCGGSPEVGALERMLEELGLNYWNYPLDETEHVMENCEAVMLVEFPTDAPGIYEYRWCEVENDDD